jgi:prevent-host-death family protein
MVMTMAKTRSIPAGKFKAECLALLDRVQATGEALVVTKRGKPVARLVPMQTEAPRSLLGSVCVQGDLLEPIDVPWDANR